MPSCVLRSRSKDDLVRWVKVRLDQIENKSNKSKLNIIERTLTSELISEF